MSGAALTFDVPVVAGDYEFRFFANNGYVRLAASGVLTVAPLAMAPELECELGSLIRSGASE